MVGYSEQHASGTYQIFMLELHCTINTRDICWMNMYYGTWIQTTDGIANAPDLDDINDDNDANSQASFVYISNLPKSSASAKEEAYDDNDEDSMPSLERRLDESVDSDKDDNKDNLVSPLDQ